MPVFIKIQRVRRQKVWGDDMPSFYTCLRILTPAVYQPAPFATGMTYSKMAK